jgi:hypothetical protein
MCSCARSAVHSHPHCLELFGWPLMSRSAASKVAFWELGWCVLICGTERAAAILVPLSTRAKVQSRERIGITRHPLSYSSPWRPFAGDPFAADAALRSAPERRSLIDRRSPIFSRSRSERLSTPLRRSRPALRASLDRRSSLVIVAAPFEHAALPAAVKDEVNILPIDYALRPRGCSQPATEKGRQVRPRAPTRPECTRALLRARQQERRGWPAQGRP